MARTIALDVGTKTIGVAVSDKLGITCTPVTTISRKGVKKDTAQITRLITEMHIEEVVVGLPYELDDTEGRSAKLARQIGEAVRDASNIPLHYVDERYSSVDAEEQLIAQNLSRKRRKAVIDQAAAMIILRSWLDHGENI